MEPKTEIFILPHILSIALSFHGCPHVTCPLCLLPSVSSVWATALDDSGSEYCPLTPVSHLFSFYVWLFSYSLVSLSPGFSLPHLETLRPVACVTMSAAHTVSACPCLTCVVYLGPLCFPSLDSVVGASLKPQGLCSVPHIPFLLPSICPSCLLPCHIRHPIASDKSCLVAKIFPKHTSSEKLHCFLEVIQEV